MIIAIHSAILPERGKQRHVVAENQQQDRRSLATTILNLPSGDAGMATPRDCARLRSTVTANLAAENHDDHPGLRQIHLHERDERRGDQQLVGQRIHELAERA